MPTHPTSDPEVTISTDGVPPTKITFTHQQHGWLVEIAMVIISPDGEGLATIDVILRALTDFPEGQRAALWQLQRRLLASVMPTLTRPGGGVMPTVSRRSGSAGGTIDADRHAGAGHEPVSD